MDDDQQPQQKDEWLGRAVSVHCIDKLGVFQGIIQDISPSELVIVRAFRNGVPLRNQDAEVRLRSADIAKINLIPVYNGQTTLKSTVINKPTPVKQPNFANACATASTLITATPSPSVSSSTATPTRSSQANDISSGDSLNSINSNSNSNMNADALSVASIEAPSSSSYPFSTASALTTTNKNKNLKKKNDYSMLNKNFENFNFNNNQNKNNNDKLLAEVNVDDDHKQSRATDNMKAVSSSSYSNAMSMRTYQSQHSNSSNQSGKTISPSFSNKKVADFFSQLIPHKVEVKLGSAIMSNYSTSYTSNAFSNKNKIPSRDDNKQLVESGGAGLNTIAKDIKDYTTTSVNTSTASAVAAAAANTSNVKSDTGAISKNHDGRINHNKRKDRNSYINSGGQSSYMNINGNGENRYDDQGCVDNSGNYGRNYLNQNCNGIISGNDNGHGYGNGNGNGNGGYGSGNSNSTNGGNGNGNGAYGNGNGNGGYGNGNGGNRRQRRQQLRRENSQRVNQQHQTFDASADDPLMQQDFDFEGNLKLFDKKAIYNNIEANQQSDALPRKADYVQPQYRHDENILASKPLKLRQIKSIFELTAEFVTDDSLIVPTIPIFVRNKIELAAHKAGLTLQRQFDILGRGASDLAMMVLGGARRMTPNNSHQWPKIVIVCETSELYRSAIIGAATGRHLASHGLEVTLYLEEHPTIETKCTELLLFNATNNKIVYNVNDLPIPDLVILLTEKSFIADDIKNWLSDTRASILAIDPPTVGVDGVPLKYSLLPILPLNGLDKDTCGKIYLCNLSIPNQFFRDAGLKYKSPFGHKFVIPLHVKD